jgi:hypothetical protein
MLWDIKAINLQHGSLNSKCYSLMKLTVINKLKQITLLVLYSKSNNQHSLVHTAKIISFTHHLEVDQLVVKRDQQLLVVAIIYNLTLIRKVLHQRIQALWILKLVEWDLESSIKKEKNFMKMQWNKKLLQTSLKMRT